MSAWVVAGAVACGAAGAFARFALDTVVQRTTTSAFPLGTLVVNLSGSFLLGLLFGLDAVGTGAVVVGTGFLGSFTTFSTWMVETERLGEDALGGAAALNLCGSAALGLAAAAAGWGLGVPW
jgi:CrcB protein